MEKKQCIVITLPESLAEVPVKIVRNPGYPALVLSISPAETLTQPEAETKKYIFIWQQTGYLKVESDEIIWIEADGSYSNIHLTGNRTMVISFHLAVIEKKLLTIDFIRIHRSRIINLKHVTFFTGNSVKIGNTLITLGREYRKTFFQHCIFLGVRQANKEK